MHFQARLLMCQLLCFDTTTQRLEAAAVVHSNLFMMFLQSDLIY